MRKCTSFPSLVVLKHIHMFPFLLLPLLSLSLTPSFLPSHSYFPYMKNGFGAQMDDMTRWSGVFLLLSCCWLSRLTVGQIQFGALECVKAISTRTGLLVELCANRGSRSLSTSHRLEHTNLRRPSIVCGPVFFFFHFFFSLSVSLSLPLSPSRSLFPCLRKTICFKTRAKYYHIYIFLFQEGSNRGSVWCGFFFSFFLVERSWSRVRLCLKL